MYPTLLKKNTPNPFVAETTMVLFLRTCAVGQEGVRSDPRGELEESSRR